MNSEKGKYELEVIHKEGSNIFRAYDPMTGKYLPTQVTMPLFSQEEYNCLKEVGKEILKKDYGIIKISNE